MTSANMVCTGCACLCDDIEAEIDGNRFARIENACAKGAAFLSAGENPQRRTACAVTGESVSPEEAIERAADLLLKARNPLIFGLDNSTLETQAIGIKLAKALRATIDDNSSFCQGPLIQSIFSGDIPTCSLTQASDAADLFIFWGSNPHHSHPRHLSRFSYYAHQKSRKSDFMPDVVLSCVDVRDTETSQMAYPVFKINPGEDRGFIQSILDTANGKPGTKDSQAFNAMVGKSSFCVIFAGLGLTYSLDGEFQLFGQMIRAFTSSTRMAVIPMVGHSNMRGFNLSLYEETGYVNKVSFAEGGVSHGQGFSFLERVRTQSADCVLIVGSDPVSNLPRSLVGKLRDVPVICIDPFVTPTTKSADVVLGTAISGVEVGGRAVRMDGEEVIMKQAKSTDFMSDEDILSRLLSRISK